jgi:hypothetical protein
MMSDSRNAFPRTAVGFWAEAGARVAFAGGSDFGGFYFGYFFGFSRSLPAGQGVM